jgi:hypothetical protein
VHAGTLPGGVHHLDDGSYRFTRCRPRRVSLRKKDPDGFRIREADIQAERFEPFVTIDTDGDDRA